MGERSKVYMTDLRCRPGVSLLNKLEKLMRTAGIGEINFERKLVAIKMHFGEPGNLAFLRPNYAKVVADVVKSLGGVPFLTDCNTLYPGRRKNALEHLDAAYENGFSPLSTGCQVIIGDGLRGNDDVEVPVEGAEYIQTAKIGKAIMEADVIISLSHFKGHEQTGFGGAIKNLGMGCGSRRGKMEQHAQGKPMVAPRRCVGCPVRPRRHHLWGGPQGVHRLGQVRGLRPLYCSVQHRRHPPRQRRGHGGAGLPHGGVRQGGGGRPSPVPYQPCHRRVPLLRLPRGERPAHRARRGHVRLL